jgi:hypothetical protein
MQERGRGECGGEKHEAKGVNFPGESCGNDKHGCECGSPGTYYAGRKREDREKNNGYADDDGSGAG